MKKPFVIWRAPFRWMRLREFGTEPDFTRPDDFQSVIANAYESFEPETICNDRNWELLQRCGADVAIVRERDE